MSDDRTIERLVRTLDLALHPNTGPAERNAAAMGAIRLLMSRCRNGQDVLDMLADGACDGREPPPPPPEEWWEGVEIPFGKYRGKKLKYVICRDPGYVDWMLANCALRQSLKAALQRAAEWMWTAPAP